MARRLQALSTSAGPPRASAGFGAPGLLLAALFLAGCGQAAPPPGPQSECLTGATRPCYSGPAGTAEKGACLQGKQACGKDGKWGKACTGEVLPKKETCNDKDDDCDGKADEDFGNKAKQCSRGVGECARQGTWHCDESGALACSADPAQPGVEICDGKDNDCDGKVDELAECNGYLHSAAICSGGGASTSQKYRHWQVIGGWTVAPMSQSKNYRHRLVTTSFVNGAR